MTWLFTCISNNWKLHNRKINMTDIFFLIYITCQSYITKQQLMDAVTNFNFTILQFIKITTESKKKHWKNNCQSQRNSLKIFSNWLNIGNHNKSRMLLYLLTTWCRRHINSCYFKVCFFMLRALLQLRISVKLNNMQRVFLQIWTFHTRLRQRVFLRKWTFHTRLVKDKKQVTVMVFWVIWVTS